LSDEPEKPSVPTGRGGPNQVEDGNHSAPIHAGDDYFARGVVPWGRLAVGLVAGLAAGAVVIAIAGSRMGPQIAHTNLASLQLGYLAMAALCLAVLLLADALTLVALARALCPMASRRGVFGVAFESHLVGGATSFGGLEIPYQVVRLRHSGLNSSQATSVVLAKGMIHTSLLAIVAAGALVPALGTRLTPLERWVLVGVILGVIVGWVAVALWTRRPAGLRLVPKHMKKYLTSFREANLVLMHAGWRAIVLVVALQAVYWMAMFATIPLILLALGWRNGSIVHVIVAQAALQVIMPFSPLPGGAGIAELGYLGLIGSSVPANIRVVSLLLWRIATWVVPMTLGALVIGVRVATSKGKGQRVRRQEVSRAGAD
jgi:glycosyltransferase 2 family protein